jgi:hypothetical protein
MKKGQKETQNSTKHKKSRRKISGFFSRQYGMLKM